MSQSIDPYCMRRLIQGPFSNSDTSFETGANKRVLKALYCLIIRSKEVRTAVSLASSLTVPSGTAIQYNYVLGHHYVGDAGPGPWLLDLTQPCNAKGSQVYNLGSGLAVQSRRGPDLTVYALRSLAELANSNGVELLRPRS